MALGRGLGRQENLRRHQREQKDKENSEHLIEPLILVKT
jgi:hypothetical protein